VFLPADCGRNQTRGARAMDGKASDSIVTAIGIDIGKNTFHLVVDNEIVVTVPRFRYSATYCTRLVPVIPRATRLGRPRPDVTAAAALLCRARPAAWAGELLR
jgi:hypothetical protein